jgi:hypothetical protein
MKGAFKLNQLFGAERVDIGWHTTKDRRECNRLCCAFNVRMLRVAQQEDSCNLSTLLFELGLSKVTRHCLCGTSCVAPELWIKQVLSAVNVYGFCVSTSYNGLVSHKF